jgi:hypothetical protein
MANDQSFPIDTMVLEHFDDLISLIPDESPEILKLLSYYAILRFKQFKRRGNQEDLDEAIQKCREGNPWWKTRVTHHRRSTRR